jgi:aerobic carbon-monoxide dehydrogenase large subunit
VAGWGRDLRAARADGPHARRAEGRRSGQMVSNTVGRSAYRGPWMLGTVARETLLDITAHQIGIDPVELRHRNLLR